MHKAKWLGVGCFVQGIGCLVFASPQFIFFNSVAPAAANSRFQVCLPERNETYSECESTNGIAYAILIIGQIFLGAGAAPLFTLGITYLDDLVHPRYVSLHLGIVYTLQVLGPAIGLGLGGVLLSVYIDPWIRTNLEQTDASYLGAWWVGFIVAGVLSLLISIPFFMFPRQLKDADEVKKAREEEMAKRGDRIPPKNAKIKDVIKDFFHQLKQLLTNITYLLNIGSVASGALAVIGLVTFVPKFVENQFYFPASQANLIVGGTAIVTASKSYYYSTTCGAHYNANFTCLYTYCSGWCWIRSFAAVHIQRSSHKGQKSSTVSDSDGNHCCSSQSWLPCTLSYSQDCWS